MAKYADLEASVAVTLESTLGERKDSTLNKKSEKEKEDGSRIDTDT